MFVMDKDRIDALCEPSQHFKNVMKTIIDGLHLYNDDAADLYETIMMYASYERSTAAYEYYKYMEELKHGKR